MSSTKLVKDVLGHMKRTGNIVGATPRYNGRLGPGRIGEENDGHEERDMQKPKLLSFRSYNPTLKKDDFVSLLPQATFSTEIAPDSMPNFNVIKVRDPRYFQFRDKYDLVFANYKDMKQFNSQVAFSRIDGIRPRFQVCHMRSSHHLYAKYVVNLQAAFHSRQEYFEIVRKPQDKIRTSEKALSLLQQNIAPVERQSLLVWNFPSNLRPYDIMDKYWSYDIKHCFKLFWDPDTGKTLTYMAFNSDYECNRFNRIFHGAYFNENDECKLLIEALN